MNVELIDYTGKGRMDEKRHAANMLVYTKNARLSLEADRFESIREMSDDAIAQELEYMASTIPSSWEFVDLTFVVRGVSRACAQQMTRTRTASYAMQSQRVTAADDMDVVNPFSEITQSGMVDPLWARFQTAVSDVKHHASMLRANGADSQDVRGIMPINTACNLVCKYNLRSLVDLIRARKSLRTQSEYRDVVLRMEELVVAAWPWAATFFESPHKKAIEKIEAIIENLGLDVGEGHGWELAKAIDLLRK